MLSTGDFRDMLYMEYIVKFNVKFSIKSLALIILAIFVMVSFSKSLANRKIEKRNIVEAVKNAGNVKKTGKHTKYPKIVAKLFNIEGVIAYKHVREDKSRYKTIVISLIASIILFLCTNGVIDNFYKSGILIATSMNYLSDYGFRIDRDQDEESAEKIIEYLKENNLITDYCFFSSEKLEKVKIPEEKISKDMKKLIKKGVHNLQDGKIEMNSIVQYYYGESYEKLLNKASLNELNDNEVILVNNIIPKTKYEKNIELTNYKVRRNI